MKAKRKRTRTRNRVQHIKLGERELDILEEEIKDKNAVQRNAPILQQLLLEDPVLNGFLFDPTLLPMLMARVYKQISADKTFTGEKTDNAGFFRAMMDALIPQFHPHYVLNELLPIVKETKVKREKRVLIWALGDLMGAAYHNVPLTDSAVFQTIVTTSIDQATDLSQQANRLREGAEPYHFNYEDYLDKEITETMLKALVRQFGPNIRHLHKIMSLWALEAFEHVKKPFGLRFHQVISHPAAFPHKYKQNSLIVTSGQDPEPFEEEDDEMKYQRLVYGVSSDFSRIDLEDLLSSMISSLRAAAFGDVSQNELKGLLNTAAYSLLLPFYMDNPFLFKVYEESGDKALELNPEDEKTCIIEIKSSPRNPRAYCNYAEKLLEKGETDGALRVYLRARDLGDAEDPELEQKINGLIEQRKEKLSDKTGESSAG